jgi:hypothetical protein
MNQRHIFTALAIIAVTGAVSDRHTGDRGGLEGAPLLYAQLATGVPAEIQLQYHYISPEMLSQIDGKGAQSHYGMKDASTSSSEARPAETQPYGNYSPTGQSSVTTTGGHEYLSGVPTTPGADPLVQDLSHGLSPR